jgi:hypothetical protein
MFFQNLQLPNNRRFVKDRHNVPISNLLQFSNSLAGVSADLEEVDALEVVKSCDAVLGFCLWIHSCSLQESEALLFIFVDLLMPKRRLLHD